MGASGVRTQTVEAVAKPDILDQSDLADRVDFAVDDQSPQVTGRFLDAIAHGRRGAQRVVERCQRTVFLARESSGEQVLIRRAHLRAGREQQHPGRQAVEPVSGRERVVAEFTPQPHQSGLGDVPPARHGREERRFVDDDNVLVAVQDRQVERDLDLVGQVPIQVIRRVGTGGSVEVGAIAICVDHFASGSPLP